MSFNTSIEPLRVLMMPDYRVDNPYQTLLAKVLQSQGVEVLFPTGYRRVFPIFRVVKTNANQIDILHIHWLSPYLKGKNSLSKLVYSIKLLIDIVLTKWAGVKVVWTIHNQISHDSQFPLLEMWTQRILLKLVDQIIVHQSSALEDIAQTYKVNALKTEVIPHGHYREVYDSLIDPVAARKALGLPLSGRVYLNLGMLRPYKGIEDLLQVWKDNKEFLQENSLLIVGKPLNEAYGQKLKEQASNLERVFLHPDFVEDSQIHLFFSAADVIVLPFKRILTSGSLILAMSYGKPIIAPRTSGISETLSTADWLLYDPEDCQGLLQALKESTQSDLIILSQLVKKACDRIDWENIGRKTQQVYQAMLIS
ncbi:MAG: glycosyltransferase [Aulosira sp. ZfuVER01]|nr:glycosyltransferase [Aulosira sp. ZfuVER01]MDZ7997745.1 glycosyltransferase [Aulosira sp. DedVER01a]MDZ8052240.1 glycosyltransferase [Aulosira sp. ZfuCHP01]